MKTFYKLFIAFFTILIINSCGKAPARPEINNFELGLNNSNIGYIGTDIHAEGEIISEGKIDKIKIQIHPENAPGSTWEVDTTYTDFKGLKNTEFHEHLEIPVNAKEGIYKFHLTITDLEGQTTDLERNLTLQILTDNIMPIITITEAPLSNYTSGQTIKISGKVTDNIGIGGLYVGLVKANQGLKDSEISNSNTISLLHTQEFEEPNDVSFSCSLKVGDTYDNDSPKKSINWESGDYYIIVKTPNLGGGDGFSSHFPLKITL